jgi:HEAT repeat protein
VIQALGNTRLPGAIPLLVQILQDKTITSTNQGSLTREHLENMAIENLGRLQHPNAFEPDARQEVADAAYLAEQRILGLAYF